MDPLSITASVLAVIGAAQKCAQGISQLRSLQKAPEQLAALNNEVSDLQAVVTQVAAVGQTLPSQSEDHRNIVLALETQIRRAGAQLDALRTLIEYHLVKHTKKGNVKVARMGWYRERENIAHMQQDLQSTRLNISAALGVVNSSALTRIELKISQISAQQVAGSEMIAGLTGQLSGNIQDPASADPPIKGTQSEAHDSPVTELLNSCKEFRECLDPESANPLSHALISITAQPRGFWGSACSSGCSCICHVKQSFKLPQFLRGVMGTLFIGYSGLPAFSESCDDTSCRRRTSPSIDLTYCFPAWFLARALSLNLSVASTGGIRLMIRLPRVTDWSSPLWQLCRVGELSSIQRLFVEGKASPWDVNVYSQSALHYAARCTNLTLSKFLIEQGADMNLPDENGRRPIDSAWDQVLSKSIPPADIETVTRIYNDPDYLESRQFTPLHKFVLGLEANPLLPETFILEKAEDINKVDASGRTSLSWAATRKEHQHMKLLLDTGADPRLPDREGNPPLFHAVRASDLDGVRMLLDNNADLHRRDVFGGVVLHSACQANDHPELISLLVSAGLSVDTVDRDGNPPVHYAAWRDLPGNVTKLLDLGARTDLADFAGDRVINIAINHGASRVLDVLLNRRIDLGHRNKRGQTILHAAARAPHLSIIQLLSKSDLRAVDLKAVEVEGKNFGDYFKEKADVEDVELWDAFRVLVKSLA